MFEIMLDEDCLQLDNAQLQKVAQRELQSTCIPITARPQMTNMDTLADQLGRGSGALGPLRALSTAGLYCAQLFSPDKLNSAALLRREVLSSTQSQSTVPCVCFGHDSIKNSNPWLKQ